MHPADGAVDYKPSWTHVSEPEAQGLVKEQWDVKISVKLWPEPAGELEAFPALHNQAAIDRN